VTEPATVAENAAYAVLGAVMLDNASIARVAGWLQPAHFPNPLLAMIYAGMLTLWAEQRPIDHVALLGQLGPVRQDANLLNLIVSIGENALTSVGIEHHGSMLLEANRRERLSAWAGKIPARVDRAMFGETQELVDTVVAEVLDFASAKAGRVERVGAARLAATAMDDIRRRAEARASGKLLGLPTGFRHLDHILCGLEHQEYVILTGMSGSGKSCFLGNMCLAAAKAEKEHVLVAPLEMPAVEVMKRMLCSEAQVCGERMRQGNLTPADYDALEAAQTRIHRLDPYLSIVDKPGMTTALLEAEAHKIACAASSGGPRLGLVAVDYLQLVEPSNPTAPREQQVSRVSKDLLRLAREGDTCLIAVSQLNEAGEIRESKAVWHDCTTWINLDMQKVGDDVKAQPGRVKVLKQRYGGTSFDGLPVVFIRNMQRFGTQEAA